MTNRRQKGQLLIEAMVAVSLMLIGMLGAFTVLSQSLGLNRVAADQFIAANLAAEGIEIVKNIIDADYADGDPATGFGHSLSDGLNNKYCPIDYRDTELGSCKAGNEPSSDPSAPGNDDFVVRCDNCGETGFTAEYGSIGSPTKFIRYVVVEQDSSDPDIIRVGSVVKWVGRAGIEFDVKLVDVFRNWREQSALPGGSSSSSSGSSSGGGEPCGGACGFFQVCCPGDVCEPIFPGCPGGSSSSGSSSGGGEPCGGSCLPWQTCCSDDVCRIFCVGGRW